MSEVQIVIDVDREICPPIGNGLTQQAMAASEPEIGRQFGNRPTFRMGLRTMLSYLLTLVILYAGWQQRGNVYITPEEGAGYALGIIGGSMMLLLLMYPLRKHMNRARILGPVAYWFRAHMLLGILGPVCILYHCNFQLGSTNGNIALFSMLLVAGSGLVGRYIHTKIHYGLYGKKADLANLGSDATVAKSHMNKAFETSPELHARLQRIESQAVAQRHGFLYSVTQLVAVTVKTHWYWISSGRALRQAIMNSARCDGLSTSQRRHYYLHARHWLNVYLGTVRKVAGLSFYERLFSLWHILHLPLFFMLVISGFVHVYAVHMY